MSWFSMNPDGGIELHDTAVQAEAEALECLRFHRERADEGWHPEIGQICWGEMVIRGEAKCVKRRPAPEGAVYDDWEDWQLCRFEMPPKVAT